MSQPNTKRFAIQGMHCTSCAVSIDWELEDVDGVELAKTNFADAVTEVTYDDARVSTDEILAAVARAGFTAQPA
jgi:copper chaperone CopZ